MSQQDKLASLKGLCAAAQTADAYHWEYVCEKLYTEYGAPKSDKPSDSKQKAKTLSPFQHQQAKPASTLSSSKLSFSAPQKPALPKPALSDKLGKDRNLIQQEHQ